MTSARAATRAVELVQGGVARRARVAAARSRLARLHRVARVARAKSTGAARMLSGARTTSALAEEARASARGGMARAASTTPP